jgi:hypothetical protein
MLTRRLLALLACGLTAILAGAGCGGGEKGTSASIGKAQFVKRANAICTKRADEMHSDFVAFSEEKNDNPSPSTAEYEEFVSEVVEPNLREQIAELRALGTPNGDDGRTEALYAAVEDSLKKAKERPELITTQNQAIFGEAIKLANDYGLTACAQIY